MLCLREICLFVWFLTKILLYNQKFLLQYTFLPYFGLFGCTVSVGCWCKRNSGLIFLQLGLYFSGIINQWNVFQHICKNLMLLCSTKYLLRQHGFNYETCNQYLKCGKFTPNIKISVKCETKGLTTCCVTRLPRIFFFCFGLFAWT